MREFRNSELFTIIYSFFFFLFPGSHLRGDAEVAAGHDELAKVRVQRERVHALAHAQHHHHRRAVQHVAVEGEMKK